MLDRHRANPEAQVPCTPAGQVLGFATDIQQRDAQSADLRQRGPAFRWLTSNFALDAHEQPLKMLHCSMISSTLSVGLFHALQDLAAEVLHARRDSDLPHLATLCYCEVRPWARSAGEQRLADLSWALCTQDLPLNRTIFLEQIDLLIEELEHTCKRAGLEEVSGLLRAARMS